MCECCGSPHKINHVSHVHVHGLNSEADVERLNEELKRIPGTTLVEMTAGHRGHGIITFDTRFISEDSLRVLIEKLGYETHQH
ncbi:MAG: hypothetical protein HPY81_03945 [Firmicutes bacterium]|nr:hypothetical protein [Bacillota bacterium]